ncbi:hypothetical protein BDY21DRAFT_363679 [Lineolata rhizophorae]|uniref:Uncharacterized protein n=1 Tax=Lineolata rhizophorae TaxID=578093 RepID=A0A6A6P0N6_9PEZI|nr:hypothetical protein BDY21DRAFT_363679 [Lineolata rhizophorae]
MTPQTIAFLFRALLVWLSFGGVECVAAAACAKGESLYCCEVFSSEGPVCKGGPGKMKSPKADCADYGLAFNCCLSHDGDIAYCYSAGGYEDEELIVQPLQYMKI